MYMHMQLASSIRIILLTLFSSLLNISLIIVHGRAKDTMRLEGDFARLPVPAMEKTHDPDRMQEFMMA